MYSSSRLVTHGLLSVELELGEELGGGEAAEGLVVAGGVVDVLPGGRSSIDTNPSNDLSDAARTIRSGAEALEVSSG